MAFHDSIVNILGPSGSILAGIGSIIFIFLIIIWAGSQSRTWSGTRKERRAVKRLGYSLLGYTGRGLWWALKGGVKGSAKLAKLSLKAGKGGGRLAMDAARTVNYYITEEKEASAETLHQTSAAAATYELAEIIRKLANAEIRDNEMKRALELKIRNFIESLVSLYESGHIDENTRKFVIGLGEQITSALIELINSEAFEVDIRKQSFSLIYKLLEVVKTAESLGRRVESKAKATEKGLVRWTNKLMDDFMKELKRKDKQEKEFYAMKEMNMEIIRKEHGFVNNMYEKGVRESHEIRKGNIMKLVQALEQLNEMNKQMVGTINKIRADISQALEGLKDSLKEEKEIKDSESEVDVFARRIKNAAQTARSNLKSMGEGQLEDVIIRLAGDSAVVFVNIAQVSNRILNIDNKELLPLLDRVRGAMLLAYRAEEASRIANRYFEQIIKAQEQFGELVEKVDTHSKEIQTTFMKEVEIEKMEEQIAAKQESTDQASKSLFIKAINVLERSRAVIVQHIDYLQNNIYFTIETKNYVLGALQSIMQGVHEIKVQLDADFSEKAKIYQASLAKAQSQQTLERLAA